jgi:Predicted periplasmic or secreted lipoprotein
MNMQWILLPIFTLTLVGCGNTPKPMTGAINLSDSVQTETDERETEEEDDEKLNHSIKSALSDKDNLSPKAKQIRIIIANGTVTLRGLVKDNQEKSQIEDVVHDVDGVEKVDNQLDVQDIEIGS